MISISFGSEKKFKKRKETILEISHERMATIS